MSANSCHGSLTSGLSCLGVQGSEPSGFEPRTPEAVLLSNGDVRTGDCLVALVEHHDVCLLHELRTGFGDGLSIARCSGVIKRMVCPMPSEERHRYRRYCNSGKIPCCNRSISSSITTAFR